MVHNAKVRKRHDIHDHSVPDLELVDTLANLDNLASNVLAQNYWILFDKEVIVLDLPVDWVNGDRVVLDKDFSFGRFVGGSIVHFQRIGFG
jgi:hypothetical protein